jgi:hypothetical protein
LQGATVKKPNSLILDLRSVMEAAQAYVMLSRVQTLSQLFIIEKVPKEKIYPSPSAVEELRRLESVSINRNELNIRKNMTITSLNIRSLPRHITDLSRDYRIVASPIIALQETWCDPYHQSYHLDLTGYSLHLNSVGDGKGIATYFNHEYTFCEDRTNEKLQITKISSEKIDVLNIYRSQGADNNLFLMSLLSLIDPDKTTALVGDFNLPWLSSTSNLVVVEIMRLGFRQLVTSVTHEDGMTTNIYIT